MYSSVIKRKIKVSQLFPAKSNCSEYFFGESHRTHTPTHTRMYVTANSFTNLVRNSWLQLFFIVICIHVELMNDALIFMICNAKYWC